MSFSLDFGCCMLIRQDACVSGGVEWENKSWDTVLMTIWHIMELLIYERVAGRHSQVQ